ncbi:hypothetical protein [Candidatus Contubernalis alkaliaceticus]|uniref:hypothetical protein n=1 Tax=Candidatus Contubernalis alkaliaceticus TaxID=338645 RepID=UPI001F4BF119|nr:hypothetical protein [Candidatus Contubernalis alkalaceticus]UNC93139.1 hypothetical protein HUE98_14200 [Candidatus Contubernalis alkalaceticus]
MGKIKGKLFVVEGRRLIPLAFLLILLVTLSIYDNFRVDTTARVVEEVKVENEIQFSTTDKGQKKVSPTLRVAAQQEQWALFAKEFKLELPEYPFNPHGEIGLFVYNGKIRHIEILPQADKQVQVRIAVDVKDDFYHLATIEKKDFWQEDKDYLWVLTDHKGKIIEEVILEEKKSEDTEEKDEEDEEDEDQESQQS